MPIDYYYNTLSPPCKLVSMVIKHLNLDVNYKVVDQSKEDYKHSELLMVIIFLVIFCFVQGE